MNTSATDLDFPRAETVHITEDTLSVELSDGRSISVPLAWFPRLIHATSDERRRWRLIGGGHGIHWGDLDEDISVANLLAGQRSGESLESFGHWLAARRGRSERR